MAPNRKQLSLANLASLAELNVQVQPKFLPLTHPLEQPQQTTKPSQQTPTVPTECASYWDWPADVPIEEVETKEEEQESPAKVLFSASALEANLIKESQRELSTDIIYASDVAENDDYWSERVQETESATNKPQHDTYWSWPSDPNQARIQSILKDEATRQQFSADRIVENLIKSSSASSLGSNQKPQHDSYWCWESSPTLVVSESLDVVYSQNYWEWKSDDRSKAEINKEEIIKRILAEEEAFRIVSLARIEENLKSNVNLPDRSATKESSDEYWSWEHKAEDGYWDWAAKPVSVGKGYWDW